MVDRKMFFDQPVKTDLITYENVRKFATGQGDDNTTCCLLDYNHFKNYYKMIAKNMYLMLVQKQYIKLMLLKLD